MSTLENFEKIQESNGQGENGGLEELSPDQIEALKKAEEELAKTAKEVRSLEGVINILDAAKAQQYDKEHPITPEKIVGIFRPDITGKN